jgi:GxxExxY protein
VFYVIEVRHGMDLNDITYKINGAVFEVSRVLGAGFLGKVYENALLVELKARGFKAESQVPLKVDYKGQIVGDYVVDILVEGQVILELKAPWSRSRKSMKPSY